MTNIAELLNRTLHGGMSAVPIYHKVYLQTLMKSTRLGKSVEALPLKLISTETLSMLMKRSDNVDDNYEVGNGDDEWVDTDNGNDGDNVNDDRD